MVVYGILALLVGLGYFFLQQKLQAGRLKAAKKSGELAQEKDSLLADAALLSAGTSRLKKELDEIVQLYDLTKEITRFLDQDKVFAAFAEKIKRSLAVEDCQFLKTGTDTVALANHDTFALRLGSHQFGTLAVAGLQKRDLDKFQILAQQFLLAIKRAVLYERIQELATTDSLTHVLSRRYLFQRCAEEVERSKKFSYNLSCLMIDVDHFKEFNDTYGHLVGDAILISVAKVIKETIRQIDQVGKYGGEEFCVMLAETDTPETLFVAERIRQAIQDTTLEAYDEALHITISIGIAVFPGDAKDITTLVDYADKALYQAKETGRNKVCVYGKADVR